MCGKLIVVVKVEVNAENRLLYLSMQIWTFRSQYLVV
jgi:hypothetical protein